MANITNIKESTVQEIIDVLQRFKNKNAILKLDPCDTDNPYPFCSLYEDGDFVLLSLEEYRKEQQ